MVDFIIGDEYIDPESCEHDDVDYNEFGDAHCTDCGKSFGRMTEINTSYDQEQPIGDSPQALYSVGAEPIDAKNGSGFMDVGRLGENCKFCDNKFSLLNMTPEGKVSCPKCGQKFKDISLESLEEDLEIAIRDLDVITDPKEYREQEEYIRSLQKELANEKLNKDGTGVARATRGINPNNYKHTKMMFDYVSKAGCDICSQYDGMVFDRNDEKRPIIPRLEVAGWSARPYTHPNCKCRWIKVFNEVDTSNNMQANEIAPELIARGKAWYGDGWDDLKLVEKQLIVIKMLQKSLGMSESFVEEPVPLVSIEAHILKKKANEYAGNPTGKPHNYGIQRILDGLVGNNLQESKKNEIESTIGNDFTLENLLALTAKALADKLGKKLGVESKANEYNDLWYASQFAKLPSWQSDRFTSSDSLSTKLSKLFNQYGFDISEHDVKNGMYGLDERMPVELMANILNGKTSNEGYNADTGEMECDKCEAKFSPNDDWQMSNYKKHMRTHESYSNEDHASDYWREYNYAKRMIKDENITEKGDDLQWKLMEKGIGVDVADRIANEGGKGSGKAGHSPWMLGTYLAEECPNCMISTERENGKCVICRN